jgi:hypothetical protein
MERLIYINIYGLGLASSGLGLVLGLAASGLGLDVAGLVNITEKWLYIQSNEHIADN